MPEKPMKASASRPAQRRANGVPRIPLGVSVSSSCSRMPANIHNARVNPMLVDTPYVIDSMRLKFFCTTRIATPNTAQLVVMSGRNTPKA